MTRKTENIRIGEHLVNGTRIVSVEDHTADSRFITAATFTCPVEGRIYAEARAARLGARIVDFSIHA